MRVPSSIFLSTWPNPYVFGIAFLGPMNRGVDALPEKLAAIWLEAPVTSEFELDTLPLLFSSEDEFDAYYDDLLVEHEGELGAAIKEIKSRNADAREECLAGRWSECLEGLESALSLRRIAFPPGHESHYKDCTLAEYHLLMSLITFGTWFLKEAGEQKDLRVREAYEIRAFDVFCKVCHS